MKPKRKDGMAEEPTYILMLAPTLAEKIVIALPYYGWIAMSGYAIYKTRKRRAMRLKKSKIVYTIPINLFE